MRLIENSAGIQFLNNLILTATASDAGLRLGVSASDPSSPVEGDVYYNSLDNNIKFYNGTAWVVVVSGEIAEILPLQFNINSDDVVSASAIFEGYINIDTTSEVFNSTRLSSVDYETSDDDGDTWVFHADINALKTWVDANITLNTTRFLIRALGNYAAAQSGEAEIKFEYKIENL